MYKYAKVVNNETGLCEVGLGTNTELYQKLGMTEMNVAQSEIDNQWYLAEKLDTEEYAQKKVEFEKQLRKQEIKAELNDLDTKRVRAICEPELKDAEAGETWLEYYNNQIIELREELNSLEE